MMEIEHCDLEKWHYQALKNPLYVLDGMADVIREDLMMNAPESSNGRKPVFGTGGEGSSPSSGTRDDVEQLRRMLLYLQSKVMELRVSKKKGSYKEYKIL